MKRNLFILCSIFIFTSCIVTEDIHFQKDGSIKYSMLADASEVLKNAPDDMSFSSDFNFPSDSTLHPFDMFKDSVDINIEGVKEDLENIKPLRLKFVNNPEEGKMTMSLFGDFENTDALTKAFASMDRLTKLKNQQNRNIEEEETQSNNFSVDKFYSETQLSWDGSKMIRSRNLQEEKQQEEVVEETEDNAEEESPKSIFQNMMAEMENPLIPLFEQTKVIVNYHFPDKVKSVSNPDAKISKNGKKVTIEYPGAEMLNPTDKLSIEILTK